MDQSTVGPKSKYSRNPMQAEKQRACGFSIDLAGSTTVASVCMQYRMVAFAVRGCALRPPVKYVLWTVGYAVLDAVGRACYDPKRMPGLRLYWWTGEIMQKRPVDGKLVVEKCRLVFFET